MKKMQIQIENIFDTCSSRQWNKSWGYL